MVICDDLQTQNLMNLIRVGSPSMSVFTQIVKGTNLICQSLGHLYTLFAVTYVQFAYFYTICKKLMGKSAENMI